MYMPNRLKMHKYVVGYGELSKAQTKLCAGANNSTHGVRMQNTPQSTNNDRNKFAEAKPLRYVVVIVFHVVFIVARVVLLPLGHWPKVILIEKPPC